MKRIITSTLLLSALALFSACQKSEQQAPTKGESIVFTASFAPETKTVIDETGKKSLWNQDEIRIFNGNHTEAQEYVTEATKAATAEFKIKNTEATFTGTSFIAVCPNSLATAAWWNSKADKTINKLWLKPEQTATVGTYDPEGHVAVAYTENTALEFKNACALLKFTIKSDNIKEVCVYSSNPNDVLSGNFSFNTEGSLITTDGDKYEKKNYVKVVGDFVNGQTYYISCIPGTLADGFTLEVVNDKAAKGKDNVYTKPIELKRSKIYNLGDITYTERPAETRTLYLEPGVWETAGAIYQAYLFNGSGSQWYNFEKVKEGLYKVSFPDQWETIIACRMNPAGPASDWTGKWNQTNEISIASLGDNNCISITSWGEYEQPSPNDLKKVTVE